MILNSVKALKHLLYELNPSSEINLRSCLTTQVGNLRVVGHLKEQFPTLLQYSRFLANTVFERIKKVAQWAAN